MSLVIQLSIVLLHFCIISTEYYFEKENPIQSNNNKTIFICKSITVIMEFTSLFVNNCLL